MFGYVTVRKEELKIREWECYHAYYCGLCRALGALGGGTARLTLTYDMTFLAVLLDSLYECHHEEGAKRCVLHPGSRYRYMLSEASDYAAAMNVLLSYDNRMDDWEDDRNPASAGMAFALKRTKRRVSVRYPRQSAAVSEYVRELHAMEARAETSIDAAAGATGRMLAELFDWKQDEWQQELKTMGFFLGKYIYLMDAYEDMEQDAKKHGYNPFLLYCGEEPVEAYAERVLRMMAAEAARAFERLPIVENAELLRNILYAGIWTRYDMTRAKRGKKENEKKEGQKA